MKDKRLRAVVAARGGNPECLHCRVGVLIALHGEANGLTVCNEAMAKALVEIAGQLTAFVPAARREDALGALADHLGESCAFASNDLERDAADPPPGLLN